MNNKFTARITMRITAAVIAALTVFIFFSCGAAELPAPTGLEAAEPDPDNPNRIELSWLPVEGADIYYVYRSGTSGGTYEDAGFSVTSSEIENRDGNAELRYSYRQSFAEGEGGTYYYRVTAASNADIGAESLPCAAVAASTYSGTWSTVKILGAAENIKLAADNSAMYAVYSGGTGTEAIAAQKYAEDPDSDADVPPMIWTALSGSPGTTDGSVDGPFSVFISGGELYTVFRDASAADTDYVSMKYYHDSGSVFSWTAVGAAKFNTGTVGAVAELSSTTVGFAGDIYSAFLEDDTTNFKAKLYNFDAGSSVWNEIDISSDLPASVSTPKIISHNNTLYLGYEDVSATGLYLRSYEYGLQPDGLVVSGNIDDGNVDFVSGGGSLYAVYTISNTFGAKKYADGVWTALANTTGMPSAKALTYGPLDAHWYNGYLYVFYLGTDNKGHVKYYDEDDGWLAAEKPSTDIITGTIGESDGSFQLASSGSRLYAGYIEGGQACVRILE